MSNQKTGEKLARRYAPGNASTALCYEEEREQGGENEEGVWVQDAAKHVLDRACTHESSTVQVVQAGSEQRGGPHRDMRFCEARAKA